MPKTFEISIKVRFADIDKFNHVNNAKFLTYIEEARMQYFDHFAPDNNWKETGIILANAQLSFLKPIFGSDQVTVKVWCSRVGNKSFDLSYEVFKKSSKSERVELCSTAMTSIVCYNYLEERTISIPGHWKTFLS